MSDTESDEEESSEDEYFDINIQVGNDELFRLRPKHHPKRLGKNTKVSELKNLIQFERDLYGKEINLTFKDIELQDKKTLHSYGIKNDKHLIAMNIEDNNENKFKKIKTNIKDGVIILNDDEEHSFQLLNNELNNVSKTLNKLNAVILDPSSYEKELLNDLHEKKSSLLAIIEKRGKKLNNSIDKQSELLQNNLQKINKEKLEILQKKLQSEYINLKTIYDTCISMMKGNTIENIANPKKRVTPIRSNLIINETKTDTPEITKSEKKDADGDADQEDEEDDENDDTAGNEQETKIIEEKTEVENIPELVEFALNNLDTELEKEINDIFGGNMNIENDIRSFKNNLNEYFNIKTKTETGDNNNNNTKVGGKITLKQTKILFQSFRSNAGMKQNNFVRWNLESLSNTKSLIDNKKDDSTFVVKQNGWYRIVSRHSVYSGGQYYAALYINDNAVMTCYRYYGSGSYDATYIFNEIIDLKKGDRLRIYNSNGNNKNELLSSYFCIETISSALLENIGVWESSSSSSNYRLWNQSKKDYKDITLQNNGREMLFRKSGYYRICARLHTNYSSTGTRYIYMDHYHDSTSKIQYNYQSSYSSQYLCHSFNEILYCTRKDYIRFYYGGYGDWSSASAQRLSIERIPFPKYVSRWKSSTSSSYKMQWNYPQIENEELFQLDSTEIYITFLESGYYRVMFNITSSVSSNTSTTTLFIADKEVAKVHMGCYSGTYYHAKNLNEIYKVNKGDKLYVYNTLNYNSKDHNSLVIEKLVA